MSSGITTILTTFSSSSSSYIKELLPDLRTFSVWIYSSLLCVPQSSTIHGDVFWGVPSTPTYDRISCVRQVNSGVIRKNLDCAASLRMIPTSPLDTFIQQVSCFMARFRLMAQIGSLFLLTTKFRSTKFFPYLRFFLLQTSRVSQVEWYHLCVLYFVKDDEVLHEFVESFQLQFPISLLGCSDKR